MKTTTLTCIALSLLLGCAPTPEPDEDGTGPDPDADSDEPEDTDEQDTDPPDPNRCDQTLEAGAALQEAVDAAASGDILCLQPGSYAGGILVPRGLTLRGSGAPEDVVLDGGGPVILVTSTEPVAFAALTVTGGVAAFGAGIVLGEASDVTVEDVVLHGHSGSALLGLQVERLVVTRVEVRDNDLDANAANEVYGLAATARSVEVTDSWIHHNGGMGVVFNATDIAISGTTAEHNAGVGLTLVGGAAVLSHNVASHNGQGGMLVQSLGDLSMQGDQLTDNVGPGLRFEDSAYATLTDVVFARNTSGPGYRAAGLDADVFRALTIVGGRFEDNVTTGDGLAGGGLSAVSADALSLNGVTFEGNVGVYSGGGASAFSVGTAQIEDCTFRSNEALQGGALSLIGVPAATSSGNLFQGNVAWAGGALALSSGSIGGPLVGAHLVASADHFAGNTATYGSGWGADIGCVESTYHGTGIVFDQADGIFQEACTITLD